jgi:hypothetical protein
MKYIYFILFFCTSPSVALSKDKLSGSANLGYTYAGKQEALIETLRLGFKYSVFEHPQKNYIFYVGGNAVTEQDVFNRVVRVSGFMTFGIEY